MDFVTLYQQWAPNAEEPSLSGFLSWVRNHCNVTAGEAMTEDEVQVIADLSGATSSEVEEALMESAWP